MAQKLLIQSGIALQTLAFGTFRLSTKKLRYLISDEIGVAVLVPLGSESQICCCSFVTSFRQMRGFLVESIPPPPPLDLEIDCLEFASERPCVCSRSGVVTIYCSLHSPKSRRCSSCYHAAV